MTRKHIQEKYFFQIYYVSHLFIWHHIVEKWIVVKNLIRLGVLMSLYSIAWYRPAICHCDECVPHPDPCLKKQLDIILLFNNSILILLCIWLFRCVSFWDRLVCVLNFFSASRICDRKCVFNTRMVVFLLFARVLFEVYIMSWGIWEKIRMFH